MTWYTLAWLLWGIAFAVIETLGVLRKRAGRDMDTLSDHVWWVRDNIRFARLGLAAFFAWLVFHLMAGGG
jgi:hypothetical protein